MRIRTSHSTGFDEQNVITDLLEGIGVGEPELLIVYLTANYAAEQVLDALRQHYPNSVIQGGTTCMGVMTAQGYHSVDGRGAGVFALFDAEGAYGAAATDIGSDARLAARSVTETAIDHANRPGEMPALIWLSAAPGQEETLLAGIADVVGPNVPVVGGSTADNDVSGEWKQFCQNGVYRNAISISVLFPSTPVTSAFRSGYMPTDVGGRVTRSDHRTILEIDHENAAAVYQRWAGLALGGAVDAEVSVLAGTTLTPLGRVVDSNGNFSTYRLSHPEAITAEGGLRLFTDIDEGDEITLMTGSQESLVTRAGRVAKFAAGNAEMPNDRIAGALVIYCAGCMLTVGDDMPRVPSEISAAIGQAPFLGAFTFGEQGCIRTGDNHHGNLMISTVLFGA
jgi:hypothetical protein